MSAKANVGPKRSSTTLDNFRSWDDVFRDDQWVRALRTVSKEERERARARLDDRLAAEFLEETVPPHDRPFALATLKPSEKSQMPVEFQARIIEAMKRGPFQRASYDNATHRHTKHKVYGWAFFGAAGWSKTTLATAWFAEYVRQNIFDVNYLRYNKDAVRDMAVPRGRKAACMFRLNASTLIEDCLNWQHRDFKDEKAKEPRVSSAWIAELQKECGDFPTLLYLDEVDKIRTDKTKLDILFDVIDALYSYEGVLLINSNLTPGEFSGAFGPQFARRVGEMCNVVDCFTGEIKLKHSSADVPEIGESFRDAQPAPAEYDENAIIEAMKAFILIED